MFKKLAERKVDIMLLKDVEKKYLKNVSECTNSEEMQIELKAVEAVRQELESRRLFKIDQADLMKAGVTLTCVLLTLHYEKTDIITTKLWSKVKF
ncbi:MAG: hypothetical protein ACRCVU_09390 [Flavobacterium sp.]